MKESFDEFVNNLVIGSEISIVARNGFSLNKKMQVRPHPLTARICYSQSEGGLSRQRSPEFWDHVFDLCIYKEMIWPHVRRGVEIDIPSLHNVEHC